MMKQYIQSILILSCVVTTIICAEEVTRGLIASQGGASSVMTINNSGVQQLTSNFTGEIIINASNAVLDLCGFTVNGSTRGIRVIGSNVTVQNGIVRGATIGVRIEGDNNYFIGLDLVSNSTGMEIVGNANIIENCNALSNVAAGFSVVGGNRNIFNMCTVMDTNGSGNAYGFVTQDGVANIFQNCTSENVQTTGGSSFAAGFVLTGTEQKSKVLNCQANNASGFIAAGIWASGLAAPQNNIMMNNQSSGNGVGYRDDQAVTFTNSTNQWVGNFGANNTTNFNIGTQFPLSSSNGTGVGVTDNIDASLTNGGPAEKIMSTIVDQTAQASAKISQLLLYNPVFITSPTTLSTTNYYLLTQTLLTGTIVISGASNVTLNLNGRTARNITVTNSNRITILNGFVRPSTYPTGSSVSPNLDGIVVNGCTNVNINNVFVTGAKEGLRTNGASSRFKYINCFANSNLNSGIWVESGNQGLIDFCMANRQGGFQGFPINTGADIRIMRSMANRNQSHGFFVQISAGNTAEFRSNMAVGNVAGNGFNVTAPSVVGNNAFINNFATLNSGGVNYSPVGTIQYGATTATTGAIAYATNTQTLN